MFERNVLRKARSSGYKKLQRLLDRHSSELRQKAKIASSSPIDKYPINCPCYDNSDSKETRKRKKLHPEETYELWHLEKNINENIEAFIGTEEDDKKRKKKLKLEGDEYFSRRPESQLDSCEGTTGDEQEEDDEEDENDYDSDDKEDLEKVLKPDSLMNFAKIGFLIKTAGLEVLPYTSPESRTENVTGSLLTNKLSYSRRHTALLTKLMHINILKKNWKTAYRCFAMLIRMNFVDIRSIWPIGLEILTRLSEEEFIKRNAEDEITFDIKSDLESTVSKDEQFLNWLESFYPINITMKLNDVSYKPFPYRVGTKHSPPLFVLTLIWTLIMKKKFKAVNDKLTELLSRRPYINEGIYYFLQGFSYQLEASMLSKRAGEMDKQTIEKLLFDAQKFYDQAKSKNVAFPQNLMRTELDLVKARIAEDIEFGRDIRPVDYFNDFDERYDDDDNLFVKESRNPDSDPEEFDERTRERFDEFDD